MDQIEAIRLDLQRTQERLAQAEQIGDRTAILIGEAREERLLAELRRAAVTPAEVSSTATLAPTAS
jgi:hypothetical protein